MNYQPHQLRVIEEKTALDEKLQKLRAFRSSERWPEVPQEERVRLQQQAHYMACYSDVLGRRIEAFTEAPHG